MRKLLLLFFVFSFWSCQKKTEQPEVTRESILVDLAKEESLKRLKSPPTAIFIDSLTSVSKMKDAEAYQVRLSVDAENGFGATGRERLFIIYDYNGGDSLNPESYELNQFIK